MKLKSFILTIIAATLLWACAKEAGHGYDSDMCRELSIKIEKRDSLSQHDYSEMIGQNAAILEYLVDCTREISELPDSARCKAWRVLSSEPEYLERFGYMFTIGSALYNAERNGILNERNKARLKELDRYNEDLARYSERF